MYYHSSTNHSHLYCEKKIDTSTFMVQGNSQSANYIRLRQCFFDLFKAHKKKHIEEGTRLFKDKPVLDGQ